MLQRCYSEKKHSEKEAYQECYVSEEWKTFSKFKKWMEAQPWEGNTLDKDLLVIGNKLYSKDTCCFIPGHINNMLAGLTDSSYGVTRMPTSGRFRAACTHKGRREYLGTFSTHELAREAYCLYKARCIREVAVDFSDVVIKKALKKCSSFLINKGKVMGQKTQVGFRVGQQEGSKLREISVQQRRSISFIVSAMVVEQLKRVEAHGFDAIFYKAGDDKYEQKTAG